MSEQEKVIPAVIGYQAIALSDNKDLGIVIGQVVATADTLLTSWLLDRDSIVPDPSSWELQVGHTWVPVYDPPKEEWPTPPAPVENQPPEETVD